MKVMLYSILVAFLLYVIGTPLVEVFLLGRDKMLLSATLYNSFRAAKEASYSYLSMRDVDAVVDEEVFRQSFADTFAVSYGMECKDYDTPLKLTSPDNSFNAFEIQIDFDNDLADDNSQIVIVTVTAVSIYKFRTRLMRAFAADTTRLSEGRTFTMKVTN